MDSTDKTILEDQEKNEPLKPPARYDTDNIIHETIELPPAETVLKMMQTQNEFMKNDLLEDDGSIDFISKDDDLNGKDDPIVAAAKDKNESDDLTI